MPGKSQLTGCASQPLLTIKTLWILFIAGLGLQFNAMMEAVVRDSVVMQEAIVFRRYSERRARQSKAK